MREPTDRLSALFVLEEKWKGPLRVAIAGASGIGKHHAKWFHRVGAQVVGFLGRSRESAAATERVLRDIFPFAGRSYWDLDRLLTEEAPDVVDVCLPNEAHFDCAKCAFERGCHVLCEKPLVWHSDGAQQTQMQARLWLIWRDKPICTWAFVLNTLRVTQLPAAIRRG